MLECNRLTQSYSNINILNLTCILTKILVLLENISDSIMYWNNPIGYIR